MSRFELEYGLNHIGINISVGVGYEYYIQKNDPNDNNNDGIIDAVGPRTQIKEVLGIGFNYKF